MKTKLVLGTSMVLIAAMAGPLAARQAEGQGQGQSWRALKREAKREKIDEMAGDALKELFAKSPTAEALYKKAYGYAVFDDVKLAFVFSGGGGNGVAVNKETGEHIYMQMGTAGVGLGLGAKKYQVVFLFQDRQTFQDFVDKGWQANAGASAVAGNEGVGAETGFVNGLAIYQLSEKGLMAQADISGTKYWRNDELNR